MTPTLNIEEVVRCFPGRTHGLHEKPVYNIESVFDVAVRENQLRIVSQEHDLGRKVPAHYFVYALGEPPTREQSRAGGLPYRPRGLKWPCDEHGKPKEFLCQIDFTSSTDLLPALPGDIMLLFVQEACASEQDITVEWYPHGLGDLINASDMPNHNFTFPSVRQPVHFHIYKTNDFPEAASRLRDTKYETWSTIGSPCGGKIGGCQEGGAVDAVHIFSIESVRLTADDPFSFVDLKGWKARTLREKCGALISRSLRRLVRMPARPRLFDVLMIGDLGRISLFQTSNKRFELVSFSH